MIKPLIIVLAGGEGKHFKPFTINKTLVPFMGKPLIQHILETVAEAGGEDVLIAANKENINWIENYRNEKLTIRVKQQPEPLGMSDALLQLKVEIGATPIIVLNAIDRIDSTIIRSVIEASFSTKAMVVGLKRDTYFPGGYLQVDGNRAVSIVEKPVLGTEPSKYINIVCHYFQNPQALISLIEQKPEGTDDRYEQALDSYMKQEFVNFVPYQGYWQKVKYPHHVLDMMNSFLTNGFLPNIADTAVISPNASITGPVIIDDGAIIQSGASIIGPTYIGKQVMVGSGALVRGSMIEEGTTIGFGTEVARSYIGPRCMLHHNFIGDSILEEGINPSYGTCTANLRIFDKKNITLKLTDQKIDTNNEKLGAIIAKGVLFGVNCTILPGITIGANAHIYPGSIVHQPIPANATLKTYQEQKLVIEE
ncbi:NTP transferase domain-containing protein [Candidatus Roizmanbacteria bacterium]|nr:NTP transferase domain-containing protein [Candidatus Roizmanbacteria bacterium]